MLSSYLSMRSWAIYMHICILSNKMVIIFTINMEAIWLNIHWYIVSMLIQRSQDLATERAIMMEFGDSDHNGRLSGEEIQNFFMYFINFDSDTAYSTAKQFLKDGDIDGDGSLDETGRIMCLYTYMYVYCIQVYFRPV